MSFDETRPESKRDRIFDAAAHIFAVKGFHAATIDEIAERAHVGKGTIYLYFSGKQALFEEMVEKAVAEHLAELERAAGVSTGEVEQRLVSVAIGHFEFLIRRSELARLLMREAQVMAVSGRLRDRMFQARERLVNLVAGIYQAARVSGEHLRDIEPGLFAAGFLGMLSGISTEVLLRERFPAPESVNEYARQVVDVVLRGVTQREPA